MKPNLQIIYDRLYSALGPQGWWPAETPFEVAVGAILTQNTNWQNVTRAIENLKKAKRLSPKSIHDLTESELASLIRPAGYFNVKARRLKEFVSFLINQYRGSLMNMKEDDTYTLRRKLLEVKGIGKETADSILLYALDKPVFVVDSYTQRILLRHALITEDAGYDDCQQLFHSQLTPDVQLYNEYHALIVNVGKNYCKKAKPLCEKCPLQALKATECEIGHEFV